MYKEGKKIPEDMRLTTDVACLTWEISEAYI